MSPSTSDDIVPDFIQEDYIQMQQGTYLPWQLADLEVNQDATLLSFSPKSYIKNNNWEDPWDW